MVKVTNGNKVPDAFKPTCFSGYQFIIGITGLHGVNRRYPYSGLHLGAENKDGRSGLYLHDDFHDGTTGLGELYRHATREVLPLKQGKIKSKFLDDVQANRKCLGLK